MEETVDVLAHRLAAVVSNVELAERHWHELPLSLHVLALARFSGMEAQVDAAGLLDDTLKNLVAQIRSRDLGEVIQVVAREVAEAMVA